MGKKGLGFVPSRNVVRGQVKLPTQGSSGGLVIGGDWHAYRSGAEILTVEHLLTRSTYVHMFRDNAIYINSPSDTNLDIVADGSIYLKSDHVYIEELLQHNGDTDTHIRYSTNAITITAGNKAGYVGNATGIHLFGGTPSAQPAHEADPTDEASNTVAIVNLIDKLKTLGILAPDP